MEFISITNDPMVARLFESAGIHDVMVDLEIIGKQERQQGLNTVISCHSMDDISTIRNVLTKSNLLVRVNPIHAGSKDEIEEVIARKADIVMLPMFTTAEEVAQFVEAIEGRAKVYLLLETAQAMVRIDDILAVNGIDAIHIGLNDLSISMGLDFLYEPLIGGIVEYICSKIKVHKIKYGFGGVSRLSRGKLILSEHFRLWSQMVIINRDFRYYMESYEEIIQTVDMKYEIDLINEYLESLVTKDAEYLESNRIKLVAEIKSQIRS
ncbi:MAG: aldolase/citrate lyase family protein [Proteiniphilum sp.]|jgi:2-keto-3-deoxy-L-rhamnonate aldolase RhmA|nr:aldolase/citrate lyase family protein [Proteiniphilum sp.]